MQVPPKSWYIPTRLESVKYKRQHFLQEKRTKTLGKTLKQKTLKEFGQINNTSGLGG
jgi:hypothetical protein